MLMHEDVEWEAVIERFDREGFNFKNLDADERVIILWRLLCATETHLAANRRIENETLESIPNKNYVEEIEQNLIRVEDLEGNNVSEKVKCLRDKYVKLKEEYKTVKKAIESDDLISELIMISADREGLKREVMESSDRLKVLKKSMKDLELDNEKLVFKLSEVFVELEEKEMRMDADHSISIDRSHSCNLKDGLISDSGIKSIEEEEDKKQSPYDNSILSSLSCMDNATVKLSSLMESCSKMAEIEENIKLRSERDGLKNQTDILGEKYNSLVLKYMQLKSKRKFQCQELRGRLESCNCRIETLQSHVSIQRQRLRAEEMFRKRVESDMRNIREEKRAILIRFRNSEQEQKRLAREITILQKKASAADERNVELLAQLLPLKYGVIKAAGDGRGVAIKREGKCDDRE